MKLTYIYCGLFFLTPLLTHGYRKYSFIWYDFNIVQKSADTPVLCTAKGSCKESCPFTHKTHYGFFDQINGTKVYRSVQLNLADRRHVRKGLRPFADDTKITDDLIAQFCKRNGRMKIEIVGWVLRDFQRAHHQATVGDIRTTLCL